jgi:hypothetical protein
LYGFQHAFQEA